MMTRAKQKNTNPTWKPFATSTPLRIVPDDKTKADGLPQTQFTKGKDAKGPLPKKTLKTVNNGQHKQISMPNGQIAKKLKRNRSTFYLDVSQSSSSSSDDDDCVSSNGPPIKINLEGSSNTKLSSKNGELKKKIFSSSENSINQPNKNVVENGVSVKSSNKRNTSVSDLINKEISVKDKAFESGKPNNELIATPQNLDSERKLSLKSKSSSYNHEDKCKDNLLKKKKIISQNESNNGCKNSKGSKCETGNLNGCESNNSSNVLDLVPTNECGKSSQQQKDNSKSQKNVSNKSQDSFVLAKDVPCKRKRTKPINDTESEKKIEKKRVKNGKELTSLNESPTNKKTSNLKSKGFRKDSSHQLFSDSMHQELINSLDLTTNGLDSDQEQIFTSPWKLTPQKTLPKSTKLKAKVVRNIFNSEKEEPKRSKRQRQQPKEFWMPRNQCDLTDQVTSVSKEKQEHGELVKGNTEQNKTSHAALELENEPTKKHSDQGNLNKELNVKNISEKGGTVSASQYPDIDKVQNEKGHVLKNADKVNAECIKVTVKNVNPTSKTQTPGLTQKIPNIIDDAKGSKKDVNQVQDEGNKENKLKLGYVNVNPLGTSDVFKQLNQLPPLDNFIDGVQTAECWALKNFKCGVLTVRNQCQISSRTKLINSYFGGIAIKGSMKMKIGSKDLEINQGDMAFVPPLTEWCIIGNHESESMFYYWCGRFKT